MFKKISIIILIASFTSYGISKGIHIFTGQKLHISMDTTKPLLYSLSGKLPHAEEITVNGTTMPKTQDGTFTYSFSPLGGLNIVTVNGRDAFGNTKTKTFSFIYNNKEAVHVALQTK